MVDYSVTKISNQRLNSYEYQNEKIFLESYPKILFVELTQNCNLACKMCRTSTSYQKQLNMRNETFKNIQTQLFQYASVVDLRGFGESTILDDFENKLYETHKYGVKTRLVTNAISIKPNIWKALFETNTTIIISVDAITDTLIKKLGRGSYYKLEKSLNQALKLKQNNEGGEIFINTIVSSLNLEEISEIVSFAKKYPISRITLFPVVATPDNPFHLSHREADVSVFLEQAIKKAKENNIELRLGASLHEEYAVNKGLIQRCSHPWEYCYIDYQGNIGYCDHLIGHSALTIGNINEKPFKDIWNCNELQNIRKMHSNRQGLNRNLLQEKLPHCNWCYNRRYIDFEDDITPELKPVVVSTASLDPQGIERLNNRSNDFLRARDLPY